MPDRHKIQSLRYRPPESERLWLADHKERTGKPMNAILTEAVRQLRAEEGAVRLLKDALFMRMNGERPPGAPRGDPQAETWRDWDRRTEAFLRSLIG